MPEPNFKPVGPAVLLIGDPTTALGADMTSLGNVEEVGFNAGIRGSFTSSARLNGTPVKDGIYTQAPQPEVQAQLTDAGIDLLSAIIQNSVFTAAGSNSSSSTTATLGLGDEFTQVAEADVPTLCVLPVSQITDGAEAANAIWFPASTIAGLDGFSYGRIPEGEIVNPYNVRFSASRADDDQDDTAIPAGNRIAFMGPPANLGLTWSLPASI